MTPRQALTERDIKDIRTLYPHLTQVRIAEIFSRSQGYIGKVIRGEKRK